MEIFRALWDILWDFCRDDGHLSCFENCSAVYATLFARIKMKVGSFKRSTSTFFSGVSKYVLDIYISTTKGGSPTVVALWREMEVLLDEQGEWKLSNGDNWKKKESTSPSL